MVREVLIDYPYLIMLMKIIPGYCTNQLEKMNMKLDEDNGKYLGVEN